MTEAANDSPEGICVIASVLSASLSLSRSVPRPTNLVLEALNPIITKLTVNTQVRYAY